MKLNLPKVGQVVLAISDEKFEDIKRYVVAIRIKPIRRKPIKYPDGSIHPGFVCYFTDSEGALLLHVTHWMPLPETYSDNVETIRK